MILDSYISKDYDRIEKRFLSSSPKEVSIEFVKDIKEAQGDLIIFLSPYSIPREDWLSRVLYLFHNDKDVTFMGSKILDTKNKVFHAGIVFDKNFNPYFLYQGQSNDFYGANKTRYFNCLYYDGMVIRRDVLLEANSFDADRDIIVNNMHLCYRLSCEMNIRGLYYPEAVIERVKDENEPLPYIKEYHFSQDDILYYQEDGINLDRKLLVRDYNIHEPPRECILCSSEHIEFIESIGEYDIYKCKDCKLEFSNPMKSPDYSIFWKSSEDYRHRTDNWTASLSLHRSQDYIEGYYVLPIKLIEAISEKINSPTLLEIGFGEGLFLYDAYEMGFEVYGIEASSSACEIVKRHIPEAKLFQSQELKFPEEWPDKYDVVSAFEVLEHLEDPKSLIDFAYRILNPGGILILGLPNRNRVGVNFGNIGIMDNPPHHLTRWEDITLDILLSYCPWLFHKIIGTKPHFNVVFSGEGLALPPNILLTRDNERIEISSIDIIKVWKDFLERLICYIPRNYGRILQVFAQKEGKTPFNLERFITDHLDTEI